MPDPIDELENFDPGAPMTPLPAAEIRRRGDRARRRRTTSIALGAAAAVAIVASASTLIVGNRPDAAPPLSTPTSTPTPTPTPTGASEPGNPSTRIPDEIDLTLNLPANESGEAVRQVRGARGLAEVNFCESSQPLKGDGRVDSVSTGASGPEYSELRELILYPELQGAERALDNLTDAAMDCPREESGPSSVTLHEVSTPALGEDATVVTATYETDSMLGPGAEIIQFVRVGKALLATSSYAEYDPQDLDPVRADAALAVAPIIEQMCVFSTDGCADGDEPATPEAGTVIPQDFPLATGWPQRSEPGEEYGTTGPDSSIGIGDYSPCDAAPPAAEARDVLGADWRNPEDFRHRALVSFPDAERAIAYQVAFLSVFRDCPEEVGPDGFTYLTDVRRTAVGGESWAIARTVTYQGSPAVGLDVIHVIRVGSALLFDSTSNEGGAGSDRDAQVDAQVEEQIAGSAEAVTSMCLFTDAGCTKSR